MQATLFDIKPFSIHDGPGIRTTVFFKGCPLHCAWCHNPEGISAKQQAVWYGQRCIFCLECVQACPNGALSLQEGRILREDALCETSLQCTAVCPSGAWEQLGRQVTPGELMQEVLKDRAFYEESGGGITCSGGEPLQQADFLREFLRLAKGSGLHTAVDTCGYAKSEDFEGIFPYTDLFLFDLKLMDDLCHRQATGVSNRLILENLQWLSVQGAKVCMRLPLIPGVNDDADNLQAMQEFLRTKTHYRRVDILPYHATAAAKYARLGMVNPLQAVQQAASQTVEAIAGQFRQAGFEVHIGG
jgi:pyruvate formate lyase activating enzyme